MWVWEVVLAGGFGAKVTVVSEDELGWVKGLSVVGAEVNVVV
jgi:hypothetical protein